MLVPLTLYDGVQRVSNTWQYAMLSFSHDTKYFDTVSSILFDALYFRQNFYVENIHVSIKVIEMMKLNTVAYRVLFFPR